MQRKRLLTSLPVATLVVATILTLLLFLAPTYAAPTSQSAPPEAGEDAGAPAAAADFTVVADGLANPRGLVFGPDGALYVAEAGSGGDGACITGPEGEVCYGETGAISRVTFAPDGSPSGQAQVVTGFASLALVDGSAGTGPHDVAFDAGGDMTVVVGLGADPAVRDAAGPFGADGINFAQLAAADPTADTWTNEVDLGAHEAAENPDGGVPDTNPFDLHPVDDGLLVADAGANALLHVTPAGAITTAAVFPDRDVEFPPGTGTMIPMQAVPTSVTVGPDGATYVGQLTGFPFPPGAANVWRGRRPRRSRRLARRRRPRGVDHADGHDHRPRSRPLRVQQRHERYGRPGRAHSHPAERGDPVHGPAERRPGSAAGGHRGERCGPLHAGRGGQYIV